MLHLVNIQTKSASNAATLVKALDPFLGFFKISWLGGDDEQRIHSLYGDVLHNASERALRGGAENAVKISTKRLDVR